MAKTIILNRICTGDYLDEGANLGHEVVNLFKPDGQENYYVYLMADGTYPMTRRNDQVEAIYFTKAIHGGCVEVVAVATGIEPVFKPKKGFKCFVGGGGKDELDYLFKELLSQEQLSQISVKYRIPEIMKLMDWLDTDRFLGMKPFADAQRPEMEEKVRALYDLADTVAQAGREKRLLDLGKAIRRRAEHIQQLCYIIENDVRYGGVRVNELFAQNTSEAYGLAIYLTYKAKKIVKPEKATYLVNNAELLSVQSRTVPVHNAQIDQTLLERDRLATTSLATYFDASGKLTKTDKIKYDEYGNKCRIEKDGKYVTERVPLTAEEQQTKQNEEKRNYSRLAQLAEKISKTGTQQDVYRPFRAGDGEFTFLSLIKKEYDELVYSNMFQYFFTHPSYRPLIVDFFRSMGVQLSESFTVKREQANIDLLITDDQNAVIIENKIKSGINGLELDEEGTVTGTQLDKYRSYVHAMYPQKQCHCFLFMPDYSTILPEELNGYTPVPYSQLAEVFEKGLDIQADKATEVYFADFVKALKIHAKEVDNRYEEIMRKRMTQIIEEIQ